METDFLKTLLRVAELGSMAEAARSMDLTPAAVAHQIRTLEDAMGAALVMRSGRTVMPTAAGYRLLDRIRPLLADLSQLHACVHGAAIEGELHLGTINTALHTVLPDIVGRFCERHANVRLHILAGLSHQLFNDIQQDTIDVAICLHPQFALPKTFGWAPLREEPLVVLAPERWKDRDPLALLRDAPFIRYDRTLGGGKQADAYLRAHDIAPAERIELSSLLAIAMMVDRGLGVALVPDIQSPLTTGLSISRLALDDAPAPRAFGLLWKRAAIRAPLAEAFLRIAREVVDSAPRHASHP